MIAVIVIFSILLISTFLIIRSYRRQIKSICRQLLFIKEHDTNMIIQNVGVTSELANSINELLDEHNKERIGYEKQENGMKYIVTALSHDIRTPLASLNGYFSLLQMSDNEKEKQEYMEIMQERLKYLIELLDELFLYTSIQNDSYVIDVKRCNINKIFFDTVFSFYEAFKKRSIEPVVDVTDVQCIIDGSEIALKRIILNIIKNSIEHGLGGNTMTLATEDDYCCMKFSNKSKPIREDTLVHLFDRFYKADIARKSTSTGLGLSIAKELTEKMNGKITAEYYNGVFSITIIFPMSK